MGLSNMLRNMVGRMSGGQFDPDRRAVGKLAVAGTLGSALLSGQCAKVEISTDGASRASEADIKFAVQLGQKPTAEHLTFVAQMGVEYVTVHASGERGTAENFIKLREWVESAGLKVWNIGNSSVHNMEEVTLNLPGRDRKINEYIQFLRNLAAAGMTYTTYAHMGNGIWSSEREPERGGASARAYNQTKNPVGRWGGKTFSGELTHGRKYTEDEIWTNFEYFARKVIPVAEELGIRIGVHPDDPPVPELGGVPRCIFGSFDGYKRAMEIADSPNFGLCLCCGCWLEGGKYVGKDVLETIQYFGERKEIFKIHFRNVHAPFPHFRETFLDNGYFDMYKIMKALVDVGYDGVIINDHVPQTVGGRFVGDAYSIGYMRALLERALAETA
jgi:mannonate dehydratase